MWPNCPRPKKRPRSARKRPEPTRATCPPSRGRPTTSDIHVPIRTCVGCGRRRPQGELVRCALVDGAPALGRWPGRGAYFCGSECLAGARKQRGPLRRAWRADLPADVFEQLTELLDAN